MKNIATIFNNNNDNNNSDDDKICASIQNLNNLC